VRVLIIHHTVSPALEELLEATRGGLGQGALSALDVVSEPALSATPSDVLAADGYVLGGPVNLGYLAGALKHFFDQVYYPCREATRGRPYAAYLHAGSDATGALSALQMITTGLGWRLVAPVVVVRGVPTPRDGEACAEVAAVLGANVAGWLG
jgi:NAD(P)H-dependent FMN reductase